MYQEILKFWFEEIEPSQWWSKDEQLDQVIVERFSDIHANAIRCELYQWRSSVEGRLAEIIVLDQLSRNMFFIICLRFIGIGPSSGSRFIGSRRGTKFGSSKFSLFTVYA